MSRPEDLDMLRRLLIGDWHLRAEFFKKFIWESSRVRQLGSAYSNLDDFLHDSMTNAMRAGHSFDGERSLKDWVESVAAWTALERQRLRVDPAAVEPGRVRLCAGLEGDEAEKSRRLESYVPPRSGAEDSVLSRIAALVGKQQFVLLTNRGIENRNWQETASAAGQSLNTMGPTLARTVGRLVRFFGAPPPLNEELEPVFSSVLPKGVGGPTRQKARGRIIAMQLDPSFYTLTPELRAIGLSVTAEIRTIVLWDAARASTQPDEPLRDHLAQCHYCADLFRAMLLMQEALHYDDSGEFYLCPGAFTLLNKGDGEYRPLDRHLAECALCREEYSRALGGEEQDTSQTPGKGTGKKMAWAAAAAVVLVGGVGYIAQHQYFAAKSRELSLPANQSIADTPAPVIESNPRYRDLAQPVNITDMKWLDSVRPENRAGMALGLNQLQSGNLPSAKMTISGIKNGDPGAEMLYAFILSRESPSDGYAGIQRAEAMPPRNAFRCWSLLQAAFVIGDKRTIEQEVRHLLSDQEYGIRARELLVKVQARG